MRARLAQSVGFMQFFATLGAGAVIFWFVNKVTAEPMSYVASNATNQTVQRSNGWFELLINNLPIIFLLIAVMGSIAWAVFETRYM